MKEQRIEYPISSKYCENWTPVEAAREILANMLDAEARYRCEYQDGFMICRDWGSGFDANCLMLGEGIDKGDEQIGQFKEGLKLAMLVAAREKRTLELRTTGFHITRVGLEDTALGGRGMVAYLGSKGRLRKGTEVRFQCSLQEFTKAAVLFLGLRVKGANLPEIPKKPVFLPVDSKWGKLYVNGLQTDKGGRWLYSYNLTGDAKGCMNRDRTVLDSWAVRHEIMRLWTSVSTSKLLLLELLQRADQHPEGEEHTIFQDVYKRHFYDEAVWEWALRKHYALGRKKIVLSHEEPQDDRRAEEMGFRVVKQGDVSRLAWRVFLCLFPFVEAALMAHIRKAAKKQTDHDEGILVKVPFRRLPKHLVSKLNSAANCAIRALLNARSYGAENTQFSVYSEDKTGAKNDGKWYKEKIWIRLGYLCHAREEEIVGTIIHEYAHRGVGMEDCTRRFENRLTELLGRISTSAEFPEHGEITYDVTKPPNAGGRVCINVALDSAKFTVDGIVELLKGSAVDDDGALRLSCCRATIQKARAFQWQYAGSYIHELERSNGLLPAVSPCGYEGKGKLCHVFLTKAKRKGYYVVVASGRCCYNSAGEWRLMQRKCWRVYIGISPRYAMYHIRCLHAIGASPMEILKMIPGAQAPIAETAVV